MIRDASMRSAPRDVRLASHLGLILACISHRFALEDDRAGTSRLSPFGLAVVPSRPAALALGEKSAILPESRPRQERRGEN